MDINDFDGFEAVKNNVAPPPDKVKPVKPSRDDLFAYYHNGLVLPKPLKKRYSFARIKKILEEQYEYKIFDVSPYKSTRWYGKSPRKEYTVCDKRGNTILERCYLHDLGAWLEEQGDYEIADKEPMVERNKADIYYVEWYGKPGHFRPYDKFYRNVYIEERGCYYYVYDEDGNYILKKKIGSEGTKVIYDMEVSKE